MNQVQEYLSRLINAELNQKQISLEIEPSMVTYLLDIAKHHGITALLCDALIKMNLDEQQKEICKKNLVSCTIIASVQHYELNRIEKQLQEKKITYQLLKGSIVRYMYPNYWMREMGDIDLVIRREELSRISEALENIGYTNQGNVRHHMIFSYAPYIVLEVHHTLYDSKIDKVQHQYFQTFANSIPSKESEYKMESTLEDFYVYMIAHMAKHFYTMGCGIRNLVDIYVFTKKYRDRLDRIKIESALKQCGLLKFAVHMELLTGIWLDGEKGTHFYEELLDYMINCGLYGKDENGIWNKFALEKKQVDHRSKLILYSWYCLPPYDYMKDYYPWLKKCRLLLPIAWVVRGVRGIRDGKGIRKKQMIHKANNSMIRKRQKIYQEMELNFHRE